MHIIFTLTYLEEMKLGLSLKFMGHRVKLKLVVNIPYMEIYKVLKQ
jgi:hypothetical protein